LLLLIWVVCPSLQYIASILIIFYCDVFYLRLLGSIIELMIRVSIFLIIVTLLTGIQGCTVPPGLQIRDWYDLDAVRDNLDGNYILMNDLDSTTAGYEELVGPAANGGKGWQPIGGIHAHFTGTFDGQGHEINDLFINRPDELGVALFVSVYRNAVIKDVGMVNVTITGGASVGSLVAINGGTVSNSYSSGSVIGDDSVGGLVGVNMEEVYYDGTISDSYYTGSVTGQADVGGLVGSNYGTVSNSYSTGSVTGYGGVGGLVGDNREGTVSYCYSIASVTGEATVGGLTGYSAGTVSNSHASGNVIGVDAVGGLVGVNNDSSVIYSYSTGNVTGNSNVGGLAGVNAGNVSSSYSSGSVVGEQDVGGLVGFNQTGGAVINSFWDTETSGRATSAGGTGKNTTEMKDFTTFTDTETEGLDDPWDMVEVINSGTRNNFYIWNIVNGETYPFLSWES
jgi:hypothetical protein